MAETSDTIHTLFAQQSSPTARSDEPDRRQGMVEIWRELAVMTPIAVLALGERCDSLERRLRVVQDYLGFVVPAPELKVVAVNAKPKRSRKKAKLRLVGQGDAP